MIRHLLLFRDKQTQLFSIIEQHFGSRGNLNASTLTLPANYGNGDSPVMFVEYSTTYIQQLFKCCVFFT